MENEIKVGEYVRSLINGGISKVLEVTDLLNEPNIKYYKTGKFTGFCSTELYNIKHSPNLKDIIQKDDFVNKCRVFEVEEKGITVYQKVENSATDYNWISFDEIEEIVTKEMMESISYKVERKD